MLIESPLVFSSMAFLTPDRLDTGLKEYIVPQLPKKYEKYGFNFWFSARNSPEHLCLEDFYTLTLISPHRHLLSLKLC